MSKERQGSRKPATKFAHLRKKQAQRRLGHAPTKGGRLSGNPKRPPKN